MQEELNQPAVTPYQRIGGDAAICKLVDRFYELMDELPEAYTARKIHPADLTESGNKFFDFLSGCATCCMHSLSRSVKACATATGVAGRPALRYLFLYAGVGVIAPR